MKISAQESDSSDCEEIGSVMMISGKQCFFPPKLQKKLCLGQNTQQQNQQLQTISGVVERDFDKSVGTPFKLQYYDKQSIQLKQDQLTSSKQLKEVKQNQDTRVKVKNSYQLQLPRYKWQSFFFLSQFVNVFPNVQWRQSNFYPKGIQFDKVRSMLGFGFLIEGLWLHQVIVFPEKLTDDDLLEITGNMLPLHDVPHTYSVVIDNMAYIIANPRHGTGQPLAKIIGKQRYLDFCKEQDAYQVKLKQTGKVKKSEIHNQKQYEPLCPDDEQWYNIFCREEPKFLFEPQRQDDDDRIGLIKPNKQNFLIKQALIKEISKKVTKDSIDEEDDVYQFIEAISKLPLKIRFAYMRTPQGFKQEGWKTKWRTCLFSEEIIPQGHLEGLNDLMILEDGQWWQQTSYHSEEYFTEFVYYVIIDRKAYKQIQTKKGVKGSMLRDLIGVERYDQFCKQYDMVQMNNQQSQSINSNNQDESDFDQLVISYLPSGLTGSSKEEFWWQHQTMGYPYDEKQLVKEYPPTPPINSDYDEDDSNSGESQSGDSQSGDSYAEDKKIHQEIFDFRSYGNGMNSYEVK